MSVWRFTLIDRDGVETVIDDPKGWQDIEVNIERDTDSHGIFFNYPIDTLEFHGAGADLIKGEYDIHGVDGNMYLRIEFQCSDGESYELFYFGRLAFDEYDDECGDLCIVNIGLNDADDIMLLRNNEEQKVDLYNDTAFDETTPLTDYTRLNIDLTLPPRGLTQRSDALATTPKTFSFFQEFLAQWQHMQNAGVDSEAGSFPITFNQNEVGNTEIGVDGTSFSQAVFYYKNGDPGGVLDLLTIPGNAANELACYPKDFLVQLHLAGGLVWSAFGDIQYKLRVSIKAGIDQTSTHVLLTFPLIDTVDVSGGSATYNITTSDYITLLPGEKLWIYFFVEVFKQTAGAFLTDLVHTQDSGAYIFMRQTSVCDSTTSKVSYINEAVSRTVEAITNDRIRFYSTFFGRTDSQPYAIPNDTCGGLFAVTNGLNIRRKLLADKTQPGFFVTFKQLFDDLNSIWNIGYEVEPDLNRPGFNRLRFEHWRYFYQDEVGIIFSYATSIKRAVDTSRLYNRMIVGYNKWEAGEFTGLDELMTQRTYRININAISKELNVATDMICSPYTIEITRRKDSTTEDWGYDNDLFGFCLLKEIGNYRIETFADTAYSVENVNDPDSAYNARITPARNAMRWFNFIMQGYRTFTNDTKLIFSSGTGNYIAKLGLNNCNIEGGVLDEHENIEMGDFENIADATPFLFPEILTFDHPMNYNLFLKLKNDPTLKRKSIIVKCNDNEIPAWIKSIKYRPEEGQATIEAYPKNTTQIPAPVGCQASIVPGSVTLTDYDPDTNTALIDFTEGNPGAVNWHFIVTEGDTPGVGDGYSGITSDHPFLITGMVPGQWSIFIVPYCDEENPGINYGAGTFTIAAPPLNIVLEAIPVPVAGGQLRTFQIIARPVGNTVFVSTFSFRFGTCMQAGAAVLCNGYPGAPNNPGVFATLTGWAGQPSGSVNAAANTTPGEPLISITLHGLSGITPSQITKKAGQTWDLNFA